MSKNNFLHQNEEFFQPPIKQDEYPFWVCQYGTTHADSKYHEIRIDSSVSCIEYIISGSGIVISDDHSFIVNKGDSYMLLEGKTHNYYSTQDDPLEKIWINFKGEYGTELIKIFHLEDTVLFRNLNSMPLIKEMHQIIHTTENINELQDKMERQFLKIIQFFYRNHQRLSVFSQNIDMIRYHIDCHITENIKMSEISTLAHFSTDYVIRSFKQNYGITPHQYILNSKIQIAKSMLMGTNKTIEEIAFDLSFASARHFSSTFEKHTGMRPSKYRKSI